MIKLVWPPEKTFKYTFNKDLQIEIPAIDGSERKEKGGYNREEGR